MNSENSYFYTIVICVVVLLFIIYYINTCNTNENFENIEDIENMEIVENFNNEYNIENNIEHMVSTGDIDNIQNIVMEPNEHDKLINNIKNKLVTQLNKRINEINNINNVNVDDISFGDNKNIKIDRVNNQLRITSNSMDVQVDKVCFDNGSFCMTTDTINKIYDIVNKNYDLNKLNELLDVVSSGTKLKLFENNNNTSIFSKNTSDYVIYNIYDAFKSNIIAKKGSPTFNNTTYSDKPLISKFAIKFGNNNETSGNGVIVTIPSPKYTLLWLQVPYNKWTIVEAKYDDGTLIGVYGDGFATHNIFTPNGTDTDSPNEYMWFSIPVTSNGKKVILTSRDLITVSDSNIINSGMWVFAIAFSTNPWNHVYTCGRILASANNGSGATKIKFESNNWKGYPLASFNYGSQSTIYVPVIPSDYDKVLYILFHNDDSSNAAHTAVLVNGTPVNRFRSFNNVFSRHFTNIGGTPYVKYLATVVPNSLINKTSNFIKVTVDMTKQNANFMFRFIGTHDNFTSQNVNRNVNIDVLPALQNNDDVSIVAIPKDKNVVIVRK